jgi:hypothetical protein
VKDKTQYYLNDGSMEGSFLEDAKLEDDFRGLRYEPTVESEVLILFSLMIPHLEERFIIDKYPDTFPDCLASRNGKETWIEFETNASSFRMHENSKKLEECSLLVCWKNNLRGKTENKNGKEVLRIKGHEIEIIALEGLYDELRRKNKCPKLILNGQRPSRGGASKDKFFEQLSQEVKVSDREKFDWIRALFDWVSQNEDFEVRWGGKKAFTMRFYIKKWGVDPINIGADGNVTVGYQDNPSLLTYWKLPQVVEDTLRKMFHHDKLNNKGELPKWPSASLKTVDDFEKIKKALGILVEHSKRYELSYTNSGQREA